MQPGERPAVHVWAILAAQGRTQLWLSEMTGISQTRLFNLKRGLVRWRPEEMDAVSRTLGVPRELVFGPAAVQQRTACGPQAAT